jgi:hypothetical protein
MSLNGLHLKQRPSFWPVLTRITDLALARFSLYLVRIPSIVTTSPSCAFSPGEDAQSVKETLPRKLAARARQHLFSAYAVIRPSVLVKGRLCNVVGKRLCVHGATRRRRAASDEAQLMPHNLGPFDTPIRKTVKPGTGPMRFRHCKKQLDSDRVTKDNRSSRSITTDSLQHL